MIYIYIILCTASRLNVYIRITEVYINTTVNAYAADDGRQYSFQSIRREWIWKRWKVCLVRFIFFFFSYIIFPDSMAAATEAMAVTSARTCGVCIREWKKNQTVWNPGANSEAIDSTPSDNYITGAWICLFSGDCKFHGFSGS